jgi:Fic family protein
MLYSTPDIDPQLESRLRELEEARRELGREVTSASPWMGSLRRSVRASSIESSTSIEGFHVPAGEAIKLVSGRETGADDDENRLAVASYARAMDHVGVMATDEHFVWVERVILDLHFDACYFQRDKNPGQWRQGPILVSEPGGGVAYRAPDADEVPALMAEATQWLAGVDAEQDVIVRAAMAHLHVVSIHPFRDGNGRVSRIVQSLVLAREGLLSPEFSSIEEYLGQNTSAYYAALKEVQDGSYQPQRDARPWVAFCVEAHLVQAQQRLRQVRQAAKRWGRLEALVERRRWPDRLVIALEQSLLGGSDRSSYSEEADVSAATASADFRRLLDADLVVQHGRGRNTTYRASEELREQVAAATEN